MAKHPFQEEDHRFASQSFTRRIAEAHLAHGHAFLIHARTHPHKTDPADIDEGVLIGPAGMIYSYQRAFLQAETSPVIEDAQLVNVTVARRRAFGHQGAAARFAQIGNRMDSMDGRKS